MQLRPSLVSKLTHLLFFHEFISVYEHSCKAIKLLMQVEMRSMINQPDEWLTLFANEQDFIYSSEGRPIKSLAPVKNWLTHHLQPSELTI